MVQGKFSSAGDAFAVIGSNGYFRGNEKCVTFCSPVVVDSLKDTYIAHKADWTADMRSSWDMPIMQPWEIEGIPILISPPLPIVPGQNVALIGPALLETIKALGLNETSDLFSGSVVINDVFKVKLVTEDEYSKLNHDIVEFAFQVFDEEFLEGTTEITARAAAALDIFETNIFDTATAQQRCDVFDMAERLRLADSVAPSNGYGALAQFYEGELEGSSHMDDVLEALSEMNIV